MEEPRTVTFGSETLNEIQMRGARRGEAWMAVFLGVPALILAVISCITAFNFGVSLAATWGEAVKLGMTCVAASLAMTGIPIVSAVMSRSYPGEARNAMRFWFLVVGVTFAGLAVFVSQLEPQDQKAPPRDEKAIRAS